MSRRLKEKDAREHVGEVSDLVACGTAAGEVACGSSLSAGQLVQMVHGSRGLWLPLSCDGPRRIHAVVEVVEGWVVELGTVRAAEGDP